MHRNLYRNLCKSQRAESREEIIGILTAISIVSKRMAKKIAQLERQETRKGSGKQYGQSGCAAHFTD